MTLTLPRIEPGLDGKTGAATALVDGTTFADMAAVLAAVPALSAPENATACSQIYNHFARPMAYDLIEDPAAFEQAYRHRYEAEEASSPWAQGVYRLCDYGMPDFGTVTAPEITGETLRFFARDGLTALPYFAEGPVADPSAARYSPVPLMPPMPSPADLAALGPAGDR